MPNTTDFTISPSRIEYDKQTFGVVSLAGSSHRMRGSRRMRKSDKEEGQCWRCRPAGKNLQWKALPTLMKSSQERLNVG